ncbi:hypothetical protein RMCBS344292_06335 [Rhizopus microsporus]|nr:hypothetical protein RMCBS344292_06335 [Rhizopus microsporus]
MDMQFLYKNEQGHVVDENGVEPMDLAIDEELFPIETISSRAQFLLNKPPERPSNPVMLPVTDERNNEDVDMELRNKRCYTVYSDQGKARFFSFIFQQMLECFCCSETIRYLCPSCAEMGQTLLRGP